MKTLFQKLNKAVDEKSPNGTELSLGEARALQKEFQKLSPQDQAIVGPALEAMYKVDAFVFSEVEGLELFARMLGKNNPKDLEELSSRAIAEQTGAAQTRTVMQATMKLAARPEKVSAKELQGAFDGLKDAPEAIKKFVAAFVLDAQSEGAFETDGDGRKTIAKNVAQNDNNGDIGKLRDESKAQTKENNRIQNLVNDMMNSPIWEDRLMAFLLKNGLVAKEDQARIMEEVNNFDKRHNEKDAAKKKAQAAIATKVANTAGVPADAGVDSGAADGTAVAGDVKPTKKSLEALVRDIEKFRKTDGLIDEVEAGSLVQRLEKFTPDVQQLLARSFGAALQHSGWAAKKDDATKKNLQPVVDWVLKTTGKDKLDFPKPEGTEDMKPGTSLTQALSNSDKLEHRMAGFLIDSFLRGRDTKSPVAEKLKNFAPVMADILKPSELRTAKDALDNASDKLGATGGKLTSEARTAAAKKAWDDTLKNIDRDLSAFDPETQVLVKQRLGALRDKLGPETTSEQIKADIGKIVTEAIETETAKEYASRDPNDPNLSARANSRQVMMEQLRYVTQTAGDIMQAISNITNALHTATENAIRNIR